MKTIFALAVVLFSTMALAEPKDLVPECPAPPYPIEDVGPTFGGNVLYNPDVFSDDNGVFTFWRLPCTASDSIAMMTYRYAVGDPLVCSSNITIIQSGFQYRGLLTQAPGSSSFCSNPLVDVTLLLSARPETGLPAFDPDASFEVILRRDIGVEDARITYAAYDSTQYGIGGTQPLLIDGPLSGAWFNPARAGEGVLVDIAEVAGRKVVFIAWFTYLAGGQQWIAGNVDLQAGDRQITMPLIRGTGGQFGAAFNPADVSFEPWGEATLRFDSCNSLTIEYSGPNGTTGTLTLQRLVGNLAGVACP